jgi:hypothetical protein
MVLCLCVGLHIDTKNEHKLITRPAKIEEDEKEDLILKTFCPY